MSGGLTVCIFAKPPRPGAVKTRLAALIGDSAAAEIANALLTDAMVVANSLPQARVVLSVTEQFIFDGFVSTPQWIQPNADLGTRIEETLRRALKQSKFAMAIGADTPGITPELLMQARSSLETSDAVIGPTEDGGFYLLGLKNCPVGLLDGVRWSTPQACEDMVSRLRISGMSIAREQLWYDIDTFQDLTRAQEELQQRQIYAPRLSSALVRLKLGKAEFA